MPHARPTEPETTPVPVDDRTSPPAGIRPPKNQPADTAPEPGANGSLFRALVDAGAGVEVAYTAAQSMQSTVSAGVATGLQPFAAEVRQFVAESERWRAESERRRAESERRLAALEAANAESQRRWEALAAELTTTREVLTAKLDAIQRELRLIWGALGVMLTMWLAVLGLLLAR